MLIYMALIDESENQSKFEEIYNTYKGLMFYVANKILNNEADSEDAVHNAFITIAENIKKVDKAVCPKTQNYVVIIAESKAIDLYRKNKRHISGEYIDEISGISVEMPENIGLEDCILQLPARYREVILLKYFHGFNCKEIAHHLGITLSNANKLDQRAKKKLTEICRKEGLL